MIRFLTWWAIFALAHAPVASSPMGLSVDMEPLGVVGSGLHLEDNHKTICLELSRELPTDWPVQDAVFNWNKNGRNIFTTDIYVENCNGVVLITEASSKNWWGSTEFYARDLIHVQLSSTTPVNYKLAVVCHELGHVLGLPHSTGDGSCMDHNQNNQKPTEKDIVTVGAEPWSSAVARNKMMGVK